MSIQRPQWLTTVGLAGALAGALLLAMGLYADLAIHHRDHNELLEQLPPRSAQIVAEFQAREDANPFHRTLVIGEGFLVVGLAALYLGERAARRAGVKS